MDLREKQVPYMGEVRGKVKLSNVTDQAAVAADRLTTDQVRCVEADALVDTGAVRSYIPAPLLAQLGLSP